MILYLQITIIEGNFNNYLNLMANIPSPTLSKTLVDYFLSLIYLNTLQSLFF